MKTADRSDGPVMRRLLDLTAQEIATAAPELAAIDRDVLTSKAQALMDSLIAQLRTHPSGRHLYATQDDIASELVAVMEAKRAARSSALPSGGTEEPR